jgi:hypothetical protein
MPSNNPKSYSDYIRQQTLDAKPPVSNGSIMFTQTRCHFRVDEKGPEKIVDVKDDYIIITHKNVTRSFHLSLFSLLIGREYKD